MWNSRRSTRDLEPLSSLVVISPSLRNRVGHYQDYAVRLIEAADRLGFDGRLATHVDHGPGDDRVAPFFRRSCEFTQQGGAARGFGPERGQRWLATLRRRRPDPVTPADDASEPTPPDGPRGRSPARTWLAAFFQAWRRIADRLSDRLSSQEFAADLQRLLRALEPRTGDIAFVTDAGVCELRGLARRVDEPLGRKVAWSVMLRRDITERNGARWSAADWSSALRDLAAAGGGRVRLYADTEPLARLYGALAGVRVGCLPIPVVAAPERPRGETFRVTYLGDARDEKGFPLLAEVIDHFIEARREGRMTFVLQSHFNTPRGDPGAAMARARLEAEQAGVEMVGRALDASAYATLLGNADVLILPYDSEAYRNRSSGVLVEALSSGAPVVVTAGSWMASQVQPYEQAHLEAVGVAADRRTAADGAIVLDPVQPGEILVVEVGPGAAARAPLTLRIDGLSGPRTFSQLREASAVLRVAVPLEAGDRSIRIDPSCGFRLISSFRLGQEIPTSAVGIIAAPDAPAMEAALWEMMRHPDHYRASARGVSHGWAQRNAPQSLVAHLVAEARQEA